MHTPGVFALYTQPGDPLTLARVHHARNRLALRRTLRRKEDEVSEADYQGT